MPTYTGTEELVQELDGGLVRLYAVFGKDTATHENETLVSYRVVNDSQATVYVEAYRNNRRAFRTTHAPGTDSGTIQAGITLSGNYSYGMGYV